MDEFLYAIFSVSTVLSVLSIYMLKTGAEHLGRRVHYLGMFLAGTGVAVLIYQLVAGSCE